MKSVDTKTAGLPEIWNNFRYALPVFSIVLPSTVNDHHYIINPWFLSQAELHHRVPDWKSKRKGVSNFKYNLSLATAKFRWTTE